MTDDEMVGEVLAWAGRKGRVVDESVLRRVLLARGEDARDASGLEDWRGGSVLALLLTQWAASGQELPDQEPLRATLATYWAFLRAHGRLTYGSAAPRMLATELRQVCALIDVPEVEPGPVSPELAARDHLDDQVAVWNARANAERFWLEGERPGLGEPEEGKSLAGTVFGPAWFERCSPALSAPQVKESDLVRECLDLARWTRHGVVVDAKGWPRDHDTFTEVLDFPVVDEDLLWLVCQMGGLVTVDGRVAERTERRPVTDEEWVELGVELVVHLLHLLDEDRRGPALYVLLRAADPGFGGWSVDELVDWWWTTPTNPVGPGMARPDEGRSAQTILDAVDLVESLNLMEAAPDGVMDGGWVATPYGRDVALSAYWVGMQGYFLDDAAQLSEDEVLQWGA